MTPNRKIHDDLFEVNNSLEIVGHAVEGLCYGQYLVDLGGEERDLAKASAGMSSLASAAIDKIRSQISEVMDLVKAEIPAAGGRADRWCTNCQPDRPIASRHQVQEYCERCHSQLWEVSGQDLADAAD